MIDAPGASGETLRNLEIREGTVIVQIPAMNVVWFDRGDQSGLAPTTGALRAVDEMLRLLAP